MIPIYLFLRGLVFVTGSLTDFEIDGILKRMDALHDMQDELRTENQILRERIAKIERNHCACELTPYNTTVEELEVRVERLEEDMFQAEVAIIEVEAEVIEVETEVSYLEISVNEIQYTLQETIETVMDHADNLDQLEQDVINLDTDTNGLENRTNDIEQDVLNLEGSLEATDMRIIDLEQINLETKYSAFFATLNSEITFEGIHQTIPFNNVKINNGEHYNSTIGIYTAPNAGIYQFFWYIRASPKANSWFSIDGQSYVNPWEDYTEDVQGDGTTVTVKLQAGQTVDVRKENEPCTVYGNTDDSWFGGHLLFPEIL